MAKVHHPILGKPALITGASSGLGRELAILFSESGHVILSGRNLAELEVTRQHCKNPANTTIVCGDLSDSAIRARLAYFADLYRTHFLICCAGEYLSGPLETANPEDIQSVLASNLTATISLTQEVYKVLLRFHEGCIININSLAGKVAASDEPVYCASKHGLTGFFRALRYAAGQKNIRVVDVFLGGTQTPMTSHRQDHEYLISPKEAAQVIYSTAVSTYQTCFVEDITLGRFRFQ